MSQRFTRTTRRAAAALGAAALALVVLAVPAQAHVTVSADDSTKAIADSLLSFRVPNESDTSPVVKVTISFPKKTPLPSVKPADVPGWTITSKTQKFDPPIVTDDGTLTDGIAEITWTANSPANGIATGGFGVFFVLVGPLPETVDVLSFPTVQTYADGTVDRWTEPTVEGQPEPANPAPQLALKDAVSATPSASASPSTTSEVTATPSVSATAATTAGSGSDSSSGSSSTLGVVALVVALGALVVGALALIRGRRSA